MNKNHPYFQGYFYLQSVSSGTDDEDCIQKKCEKNTVSVTPEKNDSGYYLIGITSSNYVKTNVFETAAYSAYNVKYWINLTIDSLKQLVTGRIEWTVIWTGWAL